MKRLILGFSFIALISAGCSTNELGETTGMGAATGGLLGAGLGAAIGGSTGDAGTGLLVGAAAGAATGAVVGNYFEAQEQMLDQQDELITRNAQNLDSNKSKLQNLRYDQDPQDSARFRGDFSNPSLSPSAASGNSQVIKESTIVNSESINPYMQNTNSAGQSAAGMGAGQSPVRASLGEPQFPQQAGSRQVTARAMPGVDASVSECQEAAGEVSKITSTTETADKLFHYRRALRLCPENSGYHNNLGEVYLSLGRSADAEFEFKESLRLNPGNINAQRNLSTLTMNG